MKRTFQEPTDREKLTTEPLADCFWMVRKKEDMFMMLFLKKKNTIRKENRSRRISFGRQKCVGQLKIIVLTKDNF